MVYFVILAGILAFSAFGVMTYRAGKNSAKLAKIREELKRKKESRENADKIISNVRRLNVDDVRKRLRELSDK